MQLIPLKSIALLALGGWCLAAQPAGPKLDDVIQKSLAAQGGLAKINTLKITGKIIMGGGQLEIPLVSYCKRPNKTRTELTLQGQKIVEAFDGTVRWTINPSLGSKDPQRSNEESDGPNLLENPLSSYKENKAELAGKEDVDGSSAFKIKFTPKNGTVQTIYVDETSFLIVKSKTKRQGQDFETEIILSDYKAVEGVMIPFSSIKRINNQAGMQMLFEKVEANVPLDDAMFTMPEIIRKPELPKVQ